jgi:hypothetical protein
LGKSQVPPLPPPSECRDWREVCKNGLQNLEPQGFRGQNLENKGVRAQLAISACTASALTMICSLNSGIKVRRHIGLWKTRGRESHESHPFAKSRKGWATRGRPEGTPCTCDTQGLLQRSSVVAASRRYVGKETDRRWEQGEDLSLVEFTSFEYQRSKQVVAGKDIKQDILKTGIRKLERTTGLSHHTINKILNGERVRRKTLAKIVKRFQIG